MMQHQRAGQGASVPISLTPNARRPDNGGRSGKAIQVRTNFFAINKLEVDTIWHYDVSFTPTIPAEKARRLWKLIEDFPELAKHKVVFDGRCNAYASQELTVERLTRKVELPEDGVSAPAPAPARASSSSAPARAASSSSAPASGAGARKKNEITVKINRVARIDLEELHRFLRRQGPVTPGCFTAIQALNVVMSHKLFSEMVNVGRSAYTPNNASDLGGGIEKWDGVFQSVRPGQNGLYANIDIASTAFIKGGNAASLMAEVQNVRNIADLRNLHRRQFVDLQRHFKGCSFTVNHRGGAHKRKYKVSQVSMMPADKVFFEQETNGGAKKKVSIPEYYTAAYKLKLQYPFLPCLGVKGRDGPLYFPAEICNIVPGRRYQKKLNEEQTAAMIRTTCIKPDQRAVKIKNLLPLLDFDRNRYLKGFQMEISKEMTTVPARVLAPPDVMYRGGVSVRPSYGSWQLNPSRKMVQGSTLSSWGVLIYEREDRLRRDAVQHFIRELNATLVENGMDVRQRAPPVMYAAAGSLEKNVESMIARIQEQFKAPPQLILVVMPSKCQTYSAIKTYCETVHRIGVMTQCALSRNVLRANKQYCGNIGLKINAKLGGMNNNLKGTAIPFLSQKPTMIIGADVTHPAPGETKPSIVAVVASMDEHAFRYSGRTKLQDSGVEVIDELKDLVRELLLAFHQRNKKCPERILFYRDGVSEGQYAEVMRTEVQAVKQACTQLDANYRPPVTFCVVKKRHHARLFPMHPNDADRSGNCVAGTVVDTVITHPTEFDFYLQSHGGLQGTSRPTLYHVLMDENRFTSDTLQELTYRLCHVYARCSKSVSIVPSVYYAHLLAYRARHYQGQDSSDTESVLSSAGGSSSYAPIFDTSNGIKNLMYFV